MVPPKRNHASLSGTIGLHNFHGAWMQLQSNFQGHSGFLEFRDSRRSRTLMLR